MLRSFQRNETSNLLYWTHSFGLLWPNGFFSYSLKGFNSNKIPSILILTWYLAFQASRSCFLYVWTKNWEKTDVIFQNSHQRMIRKPSECLLSQLPSPILKQENETRVVVLRDCFFSTQMCIDTIESIKSSPFLRLYASR